MSLNGALNRFFSKVNTGDEKKLNNLGIKTKNKNGNIRSFKDIMNDCKF